MRNCTKRAVKILSFTNGSSLLQQFPMFRSRRHIERSRINDHFAAGFSVTHCQFRKTDIVANGHADTTVFWEWRNTNTTFDWLIDWLARLSLHQSINRLIDWLIDWLIDCRTVIDWLIDWLVDWLIDWLAVYFFQRTGVKHAKCRAGTQDIRFLEDNFSGNVDIEEMQFPMRGQQSAVRPEDGGCVVKFAIAWFGNWSWKKPQESKRKCNFL